MTVRRLAVVGLGLVGGSVARAARARRAAREIVGVGRSAAALREPQRAGAVDRVTTELEDGVRGADLVVLCAPVGVLPDLVRAAWSHLSPGAVLTDVGSVKLPVVAAADACPPAPDRAFVGGHPMAGSERSGFGASDPDLFAGRLVLLTPGARTTTAAVDRVREFWEVLGSQVRVLPAEAHDQAVALISHLPHLVAYALVAAAEGEALEVAGRGFADTTRIAASAETLWTDILRGNRDRVLDALGAFREVLDRWAAWIREGRWEALEGALARAREVREKLA